MKSKILLLFALFASLTFAGCNDEQLPPSLTVKQKTLNFDKDGNAPGGNTVEVSSTIDWLVISDKEWCIVTPRSIRGSATLTVTVTANMDFTDRTATLTLTGVGNSMTETITVRQSRNEYVVGITPVELQFNFDATAAATGDKFSIAANSDWTIEYKNPADEQWCELSSLSGTGNATITVSVEINEDAHQPRDAEFIVKVGDQQGDVIIRQANNPELAESKLLSFVIEGRGITGVIDEGTKTVTLVYTEDYTDMVATAVTSTWADISPDPTVARGYDPAVPFTITSYDGSSQSVYTVYRVLPPKRASGYRPGSEKLMWAKKLKEDLGITTDNMTGGMAVTNDYVVLNTRNEASVYIDRMTGAKVGTINLGADVTGALVNFYNTADADGNILINNLITASGDFKIWRLNSVTGTPELYLTYTSPEPIGRKVSITGSIDGDAIIISGINTNNTSKFARWKVTGGVLNPTPEILAISDYSWSNNNVDIVSSSATNANADYFVNSYSSNIVAWVDGTTNAPKAKLTKFYTNFVPNAIDYTVFNNTPYIVYNHVNGAIWGEADVVCFTEASSPDTFVSDHADNADPAVGGAIKWVSPRHIYGAMATTGVANGNYTGDVAFKVSDDGYYLYVYFMFTNGHVVCYRFDCIIDE